MIRIDEVAQKRKSVITGNPEPRKSQNADEKIAERLTPGGILMGRIKASLKQRLKERQDEISDGNLKNKDIEAIQNIEGDS